MDLEEDIFKEDKTAFDALNYLHPKSHIKVFLPSIPYIYISKNTNAGLIRSDDNEKGWVYDLAKSHKQVDDYTYIFEIKKNLKFQNGTPFTIDSVMNNLNHFKKNPFLFTNIDKINFEVIKLDKYKVKIKLEQKYEMFFLDLARVFFFTDEYLKKYDSKGEETETGTKIPGAFGMGPYILKSGYAIGKKQTNKIILKANPYYWDKRYPKIKKVTIFTQLNAKEAFNNIVNYEGLLDISPIPFNKKIEAMMSKYSKLVIKESTNNIIIFFNLINGNKKLMNKQVRIALNEALNQENILNFVYKKEGTLSPFSTSVHFKVVKKIAKKKRFKSNTITEEEKYQLLNNLVLNVFTQDRFIFLWKGIEYQLEQYGVKLNYIVTTSEKDIYEQLLNTRASKNTKSWDMLAWGDDDWYYQNPWTTLFIYENDSPWSTIPNDIFMKKYINKLFETKIDEPEYENIVSKILYRARNMAYTLRVPSINKVIAVNKEVIFEPFEGGIIPLWKTKITKRHWSVREKDNYPKNLHQPIIPIRVK
jgi:peptide/nickel transport system substrate-binding protein